MRKIIIFSRITLDGVLQAPSGPDEDRSNGFKWGGWAVPDRDELTNTAFAKLMTSSFDLLLGRRTYEIFARYWPFQNGEIAKNFTRINKYVVATKAVDLSWKNSILIDSDVVNKLKKLKEQDGRDLLIFGSGRLIQTLLSNNLVDVLHTWIFPITLGQGQKLFEEGIPAQHWKLTEPAMSATGVIVASYVADGELKLGSMA